MAPTTKTTSAGIQVLTPPWRLTALAINMTIAWLLYVWSTGSVFPTGSGASVWLLAMAAHWLIVLITEPYFLPPQDAFAAALAVVLLLAPLDFSTVTQFQRELIVLNAIGIAFALVVGTASVIAIVTISDLTSKWGRICYRLSTNLGKGEILLTPAVIVSAIAFYQARPGWTAVVLSLWTITNTVKPVELILRLYLYWRSERAEVVSSAVVGTILRIDAPDIIRVVLAKGTTGWTPDRVYVARLTNGDATYVLPLFIQIQNQQIIATGLCCPVDDPSAIGPLIPVGGVCEHADDTLAARLGHSLSGDDEIHQVAGIVVEGSEISHVKFQVVPGVVLEEGMVVFANVRGKRVYYQILDASTHEESFQQNPYGAHIASAGQLGSYDATRGFRKFPWLPSMNQPVFLAPQKTGPEQLLKANEFMVGDIPFTSFGVPVVLEDLVEYHTAILGITGTGKTELALDIVRHALRRHTKVFCVDFTGEYKERLKDFNPVLIGVSIKTGSQLETLLFAVETGEYGAKEEKKTLKRFIDAVVPDVNKHIETFLTTNDRHLGIFELSEITNTKATLRTTELYLSAIMEWARTHRKAERVLIVLEEAHTIIPEAYGSGFDSETQWVVGRIGQIALQGRKYGVGLLLVSQRTALVSKTILSQCNTYFTHALVDKTSLEYLSSVYSSEHVRAIPNLKFLEFIAYGKAVKSERPLIARRAFDESKAEASKALDVKATKKEPVVLSAEQLVAVANNEDEAIPF